MKAEKEVRHYREILYPGILVSENSITEIEKRPKKERYQKIDEGAYGYRFFDRTFVTVDGETFKGTAINQSPWYIYGEKYTLEEVEKKYPEHTILISNMKINHMKAVVRTKFDQFLEVRSDWVILKAE